MGSYKNALIVISFLSYGFCFTAPSIHEKVGDYAIVNVILQYSNLTQSDVDKFKLVSLGKYQEHIAKAAGGYAVYKTGAGIYEVGSKADDTTKGTFLEPYFNEGILGLLSDKRFWAFAGAAGMGYGAYKVLYPRLERGILDQVKTFINMCENLDVYNYNYNGEYYAYLPQIGTIGKKQDGTPYTALGLKVNAAWTNKENIARQKAIENLLMQAGVANQLLSQVENTQEVQSLRNRLNTIIGYLSNNKQSIDYAAQQEIQTRAQSYAMQMHGAQQAAQLDLTQQQASALWYGKISLAATAVSNFAKNTLATLVYINDNKEKIASGALISAAAMYGLISWGKYKLTGN